MSIKINNIENCKGCGICTKACIMNVLTIENGKVKIIEENHSKCMKCGQCQSVCPQNVFTIFTGTNEKVPTSIQSVNDAMIFRRSMRHFKGPIPKEELTSLLQTMRFAPSSCNNRPIKFMVINRPKLTEIISTLCDMFMKSGIENPMLQSMCEQQKNGDVIGRNCYHMVIAYCDKKWGQYAECDACIMLAQMELIAVERGFGTFWCGLMRRLLTTDEALEYIGLKDQFVCMAMGLGVPDMKYHNVVDRESIELSFIE